MVRYIEENEDEFPTVTEPLPGGYLTLLVEGRLSHSFPLRGEVRLGRDKTNGVVTADQKVSRHHATLSPIDDNTFVISDHGSANGTYINGVLISQPTRLKNNDKIRFGDTTFIFTTAPLAGEAQLFPVPGSAPVSAPPANPPPSRQFSAPLLSGGSPSIWVIIGCMALLIVALLLLVAGLLGVFVGRTQIGLLLWLWWWLG